MKIHLEELNIYEVDNFYKKLLKEVTSTKYSSFTLNFINVEKIDLSNVQLILSLKKYCDDKNITLKFTNIKSDNVKHILSMFNLNQKLEI